MFLIHLLIHLRNLPLSVLRLLLHSNLSVMQFERRRKLLPQKGLSRSVMALQKLSQSEISIKLQWNS